MANQYKLTYFDIKGYGEQIRLLFALAKVDFEDIRLPYTPGKPGVIPPKVKQKLTFGQVPFLEFEDGQSLAQSGTITRFLGRRFNLYGSNEIEAGKIDEIADGLKDYMESSRAIWMAKTDEERAAAAKNILEVANPKYLTIFTSLLEKNGGQFFVGKSWTVADLLVYRLFTSMEDLIKTEFIKDYPKIKGLVDRFAAIPQIAEHIKNRPQQPF